MSIDSLVAIFALVIAAYSIMPRYRQLEIQVRLRFWDRLLVIGVLLAVHYLLFFQTFQTLGLTPSLGMHRYGIRPADAAYFLILVTVVIVGVHMYIFKLSPGKLRVFDRLFNSLLHSGNHEHLMSLLKRHLDRIKEISLNNSRLSRMREKLEPPDVLEFVSDEASSESEEYIGMGRGTPRKVPGKPKFVAKTLLALLPDYTEEARIASEIVRKTMTTPKFVASIVDIKPYFALYILGFNRHEVFEFLRLYIERLISTRESVWYSELSHASSVHTSDGYALYPEDRFLYFLLKDASVAKRLGVYKPVGDYVLDELFRLSRESEFDPYNWELDRFDERDKWSCPLWTGIRFFDLLVSTALRQGIEWHMWLYYYERFARQIVENHNYPAVDSELYREFPTRYCFLLYEMTTASRNWVRQVLNVPKDQANVQLNAVDASYQNGNIPKSAAIVLGQIVRGLFRNDGGLA